MDLCGCSYTENMIESSKLKMKNLFVESEILFIVRNSHVSKFTAEIIHWT